MIDLLPNETIIFQWVIFMIAVVLLHFGIFKPVLRIIQERKLRTSGAKHEAETLQKKAEEMALSCETKMEQARLTGLKKMADVRNAAEKHAEEILKKVRSESEKHLEALRHDIESASLQASLQLKQYARELGQEVASKILERPLA